LDIRMKITRRNLAKTLAAAGAVAGLSGRFAEDSANAETLTAAAWNGAKAQEPSKARVIATESMRGR